MSHPVDPILEKRDGTAASAVSTRREKVTLLDPAALARHCQRSHLPPSADLAPFVEVGWTLAWDLEDREPFLQRVLPDPSVLIVVDSRNGAQVFGVATGAFSSLLEGKAFVLGLKFRPGGFHPFLRRSVATLTDRQFPIDDVLPGMPTTRLARLAAEGDGRTLFDELESALRARRPKADGLLEQVGAAITRIAEDKEIRRVEDAARALDLSVRALQRLLRTHVGVAPKWLIRRMRLKEAAARVEAGSVQNWAELAIELGYFDQAHLTNDFTSFVGVPPAEYARSLSSPITQAT